MTTRTKTKARSGTRSGGPSRPPSDRELHEQLAKARAGLQAGRTLDDLIADMQILVAVGLLHRMTPEHVAQLLREEFGGERSRSERAESARESTSRPAPSTLDDHELLGVVPGASREAIEAAHRRAILACHPDRFAALSPAIQQAMDELAAKLNGARARLLNQ